MKVEPVATPSARRRLRWGLLAGASAALAAAVAVALVRTDPGSAPGPSPGPAGDRCVAERGAKQQDVDPDDSPEYPWAHVPGQVVTVYFATGDLPTRYSAFVAEGAAIWSRSPCIEAVAVEECPDGANCSAVVTEFRKGRRSDDTDGESEGVDRGGVRFANTIRLYTDVLDRTSDNGALATVVHEMGHALGLVHRNDPDSVMNAVTGDHTNPVPDAIDYANLVAIYGAVADD